MLPVNNLDDRTYEELVKRARELIRKYSEEWTDENYHDPGITFIELFAWLTEMQRYYMGRVTEKHKRSFLKLMNIEIKKRMDSKVDIRVENAIKTTLLPEGFPIIAMEDVFENESESIILNNSIEKIIKHGKNGFLDLTSINENEMSSYKIFERGTEERIYIGFEKKFEVDEEISLHFKLKDSKESQEKLKFKKNIDWMHMSKDENGDKCWKKIEVKRDETIELRKSGKIDFKFNHDGIKSFVHPANDKSRFWICAKLSFERVDSFKEVNKIDINTFSFKNRETLVKCDDFKISYYGNSKIETKKYIHYIGKNIVQIYDEDLGWLDLNQNMYKIEKKKDFTTQVEFKKIYMMLGVEKKIKVRLISYKSDYMDIELEEGNGVLFQEIEFETNDILKLQLQEKKISADGIEYWEDYKQVEDLSFSNPMDKHFEIDYKSKKIRFGDDKRGRIIKGQIRILNYIRGGGTGLVKENQSWSSLDKTLKHLNFKNRYFAQGGSVLEEVKNAPEILNKSLKQVKRAVTLKDYEELVLNMPYTHIVKVKAIQGYEPGMLGYPKKKKRGNITMVVLPKSEESKIYVNEEFLENIKNYLNKYRMIGTKINVIGPRYVTLEIATTLKIKKVNRNLKRKIYERIKEIIESKQREIGQNIYSSEVYDGIMSLEEVSYISSLNLYGYGVGIGKAETGNIELPPDSIAILGECFIDFL